MDTGTTRERLLRAALELFAERGYDATPTTLIAARAGVSEMTLFRHFATKASLVVDDPYDPLIADAIRHRPSSEAPLTAVTRGIRDAWRAVPEPVAAAVRERLRLVATTPGLTGALTTASHATEEAITAALTERGTARPDARIAAAAVLAALNTSLLEWSLTDDPDLGTALHRTFRVLGDSDE